MLNLAHLHIVINHVPVILTPVALCILAYAAWRRSDAVARVALGVAAVAAVSAGGVYLTGDPAEAIVTHIPDAAGATRDAVRMLVHQHQDAALWAGIIVGLLGLLALWSLWQYRRETTLPRWTVTTALVLAAFGTAVMARTAYLGGQIRHPEARPGFVAPPQSEE